jgi:hypothetical protein
MQRCHLTLHLGLRMGQKKAATLCEVAAFVEAFAAANA